jgi:hypothetical protein
MKSICFKNVVGGLLTMTLAVFAGCMDRTKSPTIEPIANRMMKTPGFWICRNPYPDKVILTAEQIDAFNLRNQNDLRLTQDIAHFPDQVSGSELREQLQNDLNNFRAKILYTEKNRQVTQKLFDPVEKEMNLSAICEKVTVRFGLITHLTDQRMLPSDMLLTAKVGDVQFDELQNSALDIGTPVVVLHQTADGTWSYVQDPLTPGWVKTESIAFFSRQQVADYINCKDFAVVTASKAELFLNPALTDFHDYVRMAGKLPLTKSPCETNAGPDVSNVLIPWKNPNGTFVMKTVYVKNRDIHKGYLFYTPRNAINQAFAMLNEPYGWGDMNGEQDCSRFLCQVFGTMGIVMPRNTGEQEQMGVSLGDFTPQTPDAEKLNVLKSYTLGGTAIMKFIKENHVILYLGCVDGRHYGIHDTAAVNIFAGLGRYPIASSRVVVSDLQMGAGTTQGPAIKRLVKIRAIK